MVTIDSNLHRFAQMRPEAMIERSWPRWSTRLPACHGSPGGTTRRCAPRPSGRPTGDRRRCAASSNPVFCLLWVRIGGYEAVEIDWRYSDFLFVLSGT